MLGKWSTSPPCQSPYPPSPHARDLSCFIRWICQKCSTSPPWHQALRFRGHPTTRRARDNLETLGVKSGIQGRQYGRRWRLTLILDLYRFRLFLPYHWGWVDAPNRIPLNCPGLDTLVGFRGPLELAKVGTAGTGVLEQRLGFERHATVK